MKPNFPSNTDLRGRVYSRLNYFIAFGFGSGLMPKASGTFGTLAAIPLYLIICKLTWPWYLLCLVLGFILGVYLCDQVTQDLGVEDYPGIVWDEILGYWLTLFLAPVSLSSMLLGFLLFRIFDIWKPQPIRLIDQRLTGGLGIMLDDVLAAIPAAAILQLYNHHLG